MPTFGPDRAECLVLVFRQGLLSAVGHDLVLRATALTVEVSDDRTRVQVDVDPRSLRVAQASRGGKPLPEALSASDRQDIEATIRGPVLRADRFPAIRFTSSAVARSGDGFELRGELQLAGATRPVVVPVRRAADRLLAEVSLHQPDFGIAPYRAMLGALRVRADVVVRASLPLEAADRSGA